MSPPHCAICTGGVKKPNLRSPLHGSLFSTTATWCLSAWKSSTFSSTDMHIHVLVISNSKFDGAFSVKIFHISWFFKNNFAKVQMKFWPKVCPQITWGHLKLIVCFVPEYFLICMHAREKLNTDCEKKHRPFSSKQSKLSPDPLVFLSFFLT